MKKVFSLLLFIAISVFADVKAGAATTPVEPALGSAENPLLIESVQDLARLRDVLNSKGSGVFRGVDMANFAKGVYFKQTVDINLFELDEKWEPIQKFSGHYDGAGHEIDGMVIEADSAYAAKFSEVAFIA